MKKQARVITWIMFVVVAFILGAAIGRYDVIYNQIIYNEEGERGIYYSECHGDIHQYWFE